eukprot:5032050-Amphidinium_carterae.4
MKSLTTPARALFHTTIIGPLLLGIEDMDEDELRLSVLLHPTGASSSSGARPSSGRNAPAAAQLWFLLLFMWLTQHTTWLGWEQAAFPMAPQSVMGRQSLRRIRAEWFLRFYNPRALKVEGFHTLGECSLKLGTLNLWCHDATAGDSRNSMASVLKKSVILALSVRALPRLNKRLYMSSLHSAGRDSQ